MTDYSSDLIAALSARAPRLHTIKIVESAPDSVALSIGHKLWPRIHKLKLGYSWLMSRDSDGYLGSLLAACTTLHSLELDDRDTGYSQVFHLPNEWPPDMPSPSLNLGLALRYDNNRPLHYRLDSAVLGFRLGYK
jgi:hypothetical protein